MKRRTFLKGVAAAGATALVPAGAVGTALTACSPRKTADERSSWDFDEVIDRSGTWSIKYGRAKDGEIPMWIADMDFRTDPYVSAALRKRLDRDVLGYTTTPDAFVDAIAAWERQAHGYAPEKEWIGYAPESSLPSIRLTSPLRNRATRSSSSRPCMTISACTSNGSDGWPSIIRSSWRTGAIAWTWRGWRR